MALPYINNTPHIGNIVGSHLPGDILKRYFELKEKQAILIGGTDEHGTPTEIAAEQAGITPKELTDKIHGVHKEIYDWLNISYDSFSRTSNRTNWTITQDIYKQLEKNGYIQEKEITLPYCDKCERYLADRFVEGTCPNCGEEGARGDQCEKCTRLLDPDKLKNPYCTICKNKELKFKKEKHLFFQLQKLENKLEKWILKQDHWRDSVRTLALGVLKEGLQERCITRDLKWGIKVPRKGYEKKVFYCWFDAPIGYISSTAEKYKNWKEYWSKPARIYHVIGKDNIIFHTLFFPAILLGDGRYTLPYNVVGLQFCNYESRKISKSKKWGVFCDKLKESGINSDQWRFYLTYIIPENKDSDFTWKEFQDRNNNELIGNLGNFINRMLTFSYSNYGRIPEGKKDLKLEKRILKKIREYDEELEKTNFRSGLKKILEISSIGNEYFQNNKPWETKNKNIINNCARILNVLSIIIKPYLPETSEYLTRMLQTQATIKTAERFQAKQVKLEKPRILFKKLDDKEIEIIKEKVTQPTPIEKYFKKGEQTVRYEDFAKLKLKIGTIKKVEEIKEADKLYKITVNTGEERTIVAGIRGEYKKEELIGKQVIILTNLEHKKIKGIESEGMLLAADNNGKAVLLQPDKKVKDGREIR